MIICSHLGVREVGPSRPSWVNGGKSAAPALTFPCPAAAARGRNVWLPYDFQAECAKVSHVPKAEFGF